jgi:26S proteasome regulatory subunit N1
VANVDSLKANIAATYVNAFVNAGLGQDSLLSVENSDWIFKNKQYGCLAAAASVGLVNAWNVEEGLNKVDKFFHANDEFLKAGACLGVGLAACGVRHESDPAIALLTEYLEESISPSLAMCRTTSLLALGVAYAGQRREEVRDLLEPLLLSDSVSIGDASFAALTLGLVFAGSAHHELCGAMLQRLMESSETDLDQSLSRFLALGLALLFIGQVRCFCHHFVRVSQLVQLHYSARLSLFRARRLMPLWKHCAR